jgi:O-antigen/teichoic acid export membrane protein
MIFALSFFLNAATNFAFGLTLSAILGPAEFGRYSTVQLASITLAGAMLDWLRYSTLRFSGEAEARSAIASSLEAGYFALTLLAYGVGGICVALGASFGLGASLLLLTPLLAVAAHRVDFTGARFRAHDQGVAFAGIYGLRQVLCFTAVVATAWTTRDARATVSVLIAANLIPAIVFARRARVEGTALRHASLTRLKTFFVYAKPIVFSLVVYQLVLLINRHLALVHLGAEATGKFSLASDLGQRLFGAANSLPELMLFQYVLKIDRAEGRAAAERQLSRNISLALGFLAPLAAGYAVMAPTFECLMAPAAYRGPFASLSAELAPGFFAMFAIISAISPIFQLKGATWQLSAAALLALVVDLALVCFTDLAASVDGLAAATSWSLGAAMGATAVLAWNVSAVRPHGRDLAVIAGATAAMAALVRPLNALPSHVVAAVAAVAIAGAVLGAAYLAFDVGGVRGFAVEAWRRRRGSGTKGVALSRPLRPGSVEA